MIDVILVLGLAPIEDYVRSAYWTFWVLVVGGVIGFVFIMLADSQGG